MSRFRVSVLGFCVALGACGEKFVAHTGPEGNGGSVGGGGFAPFAGQAGQGGDAGNDNSAGAEADAGDGGENNANAGHGGVQADGGTGGTGGRLGAAGGGAGGSTGGTSGTIGTAGIGGAPIDPAIPSSGLALWLRADRGIQQKDGLVQGWLDQSGNQMNAMQSSVIARPAYLATGFNGRPTLEFDGTGQFMKFNDGFGDFGKGVAALIVAQPTKSDCAQMLELSNGSEIDDIAFGMWQHKWAYEVESPYLQIGNVDEERFSLYAVNHRMGTSELRIDGSALSTLAMPLPVLPASGVRVNNFVGHTLYGSCDYFKGQISEIILYSRALTNTELTAIEKYLDARWSLSNQDEPTPTP